MPTSELRRTDLAGTLILMGAGLDPWGFPKRSGVAETVRGELPDDQEGGWCSELELQPSHHEDAVVVRPVRAKAKRAWNRSAHKPELIGL